MHIFVNILPKVKAFTKVFEKDELTGPVGGDKFKQFVVMLDFPYSFNFFYIVLNVTDKLQISNRILKCVFLTGRKEHSEKAVLKSEFSFFLFVYFTFSMQ